MASAARPLSAKLSEIEETMLLGYRAARLHVDGAASKHRHVGRRPILLLVEEREELFRSRN